MMNKPMTVAALTLGLAVLAAAAPGDAAEKTRVVAGTTIESSTNPYQESNSLNYSIGCQTYGCLGIYDYDLGDFQPMLATSWKSVDPDTWIITLRNDVKWHNGDQVTAHDVVHSWKRLMADPKSRQKGNFQNIATMEATDDFTVKVATKTPSVTLMENFLERLTITNKKLYEQYGEAVNRDHRIGFGPYRLLDVVPGQHVALEKVPTSSFTKPDSPDELIIRNMKEPEQRVTALLKGEIQIAQYLPPHMVERIKGSGVADILVLNGQENNFLAMNPGIKPWDNKKLRQAVAYAIDRDTIIKVILDGLADRLDGPIGPGQYAYDPNLQPRYTYDPEKAKQLLKEAGYPNGITVEFESAVNRYVNDKQTSEAVVAMLRKVGINAQLKTPERSKLMADVDVGKVGFFYYARGSIIDPGQFLSQYFETGMSNRINYSSPVVDALAAKERATFDPEERKKVLRELMSVITDDAPVHFLWRMKTINAVSKKVKFAPSGGTAIYGNDISVN